MEQNRTISSNTMGNGNYIIQGDVNYNHYTNHAETMQRQGKDDILKRLYKTPYQDRKNINPSRVPGTCDWFVLHKYFRTWNESHLSGMLWVSADPGCGKSVLVRHLVDSVVQTTESRTVCYFFFKDGFPDQKSVNSALCCILRQIFIQRPSLLSDAILKRFNTGGETFNESFSELWQTLMQVAEDEDAGEIVCLLDAIDECEDQSGQGRSQLLTALCALYGTRRSFKLKFLLTSRPYVKIYRGLRPLQIPGLPVIHLSGESEDEMEKISHEINIYICARVQHIGKRLQLTQIECDLLLKKLMQVPNRTYLWIYLILDLIEDSINVNKMMIAEATSNIPTTVDKAYERILSKSSNTVQAKKVLHIIVAAARPLTLGEMQYALAMNEGQQSYENLDIIPDDRFRDNLRNICGLCVVIVDSRIYLLHQTVKEFLVRGDTMQILSSDCDGHKWKSSLHPQESHMVLVEICIWYLLAELNMPHNSQTRHAWCNIFLDYSAKHWATHFRHIPTKAQSKLTNSILNICDVDSSCCKTWFSIYWTTTDTEFPHGFTTLMMTSYFGLDAAVRDVLEMDDVNLNARDDVYQRSALTWAARNGFHIVAELLITGVHPKIWSFDVPYRTRAKINTQDKYGRTPLTYAVWNGDVTFVKLLIKARARVDLKDELQGTPLSYAFCKQNDHIIDLLTKTRRQIDATNDINELLLSAAEKGHEEVMRLLLGTNRVDFKGKNNLGGKALLSAAKGHHEITVKLLLEAGADPNFSQFADGTALIYASGGGHEAIAKLLLEAGADVNARGRDVVGGTALTIASSRGHEAIAKLLLEAGANVNARGRDIVGGTALTIASSRGHEAIAKLLLEAAADVNAQSNNGLTALMYASEQGHEAIAKLLLKAGANVNARTVVIDGNTALTLASSRGHEIIVKLLLEAGADVNSRNNYGGTALIRASHNGYEVIAKLLLEAGANKSMDTKDGKTALVTAATYGNAKIVNILLDARRRDSTTECNFGIEMCCIKRP